jgi:arginyl-tRNA synthetase
MIAVEKYLREQLRKAVSRAGWDPGAPDSIEVTEARGNAHGDLATNMAFGLASRVGTKPRDAARAVVDAMDVDPEVVEKVEVAGPGFINFTLKPAWFYKALREVEEQGEAYGRSDWGKGKKTQVEFVSANPTGPLTIGHGRQAVLGDTIARLLEATGHAVTREYYFNDAGRQMRILGESVRLRYLELLGATVTFPEDYYQGEYIVDIARKALEEKGDSLKEENDEGYFTDLAEKVIFEDIQNTLSRLGIRFDVFFNEKSLYTSGKIERVLNDLREKEVSYEEDGAVWFRATAFGQETDRVIVKSSGEPTYRLPDIAYHRDKLERGFDLIVDLFGADHVATYPDVLAGLRALGCDDSRIRVLIHQFVTLMEGKSKIKMSTRKANFVTLDELVDEVGADVTRYFFLNRSMSSHLNFDLTLAKTQSDENPVYYVQYAHARICSVLRHAVEKGYRNGEPADLTRLSAPEEMDLIKALLLYPRVVDLAARQMEPHRIPAFLEEVATLYHRFQHAGKRDDSLRIVTGDEPVTQARLALCRATRVVLANGLSVLGISRPEKM